MTLAKHLAFLGNTFNIIKEVDFFAFKCFLNSYKGFSLLNVYVCESGVCAHLLPSHPL